MKNFKCQSPNTKSLPAGRQGIQNPNDKNDNLAFDIDLEFELWNLTFHFNP